MAHREGMAVPPDHDRVTAGSSLMDARSWRRVKEIIDALLALAPAERAASIEQMCGDDRFLRAEVESLLAAIEQAGDFIEQPALQSQSVFPAAWIPDLGRRALHAG